MKKTNVLSGGILFIVVGLLFIIIGTLVLSINMQAKNNGIETTAIITNIESYRPKGGDETQHRVTVVYVVDGVKYEGMLDHWSSGMKVGDKETIYYDPDNPEEFAGDNTWVILFPIMGAIATGVGCSMTYKELKTSRNIKRLKQNGRKEIGIIKDYITDHSVAVNNVNPSQFECEIDNFNGLETRKYLSHKVYCINPEKYINGSVDIYINRENPDDYIIDLDNVRINIEN